jgi:hypothetical protein
MSVWQAQGPEFNPQYHKGKTKDLIWDLLYIHQWKSPKDWKTTPQHYQLLRMVVSFMLNDLHKRLIKQ